MLRRHRAFIGMLAIGGLCCTKTPAAPTAGLVRWTRPISALPSGMRFVALLDGARSCPVSASLEDSLGAYLKESPLWVYVIDPEQCIRCVPDRFQGTPWMLAVQDGAVVDAQAGAASLRSEGGLRRNLDSIAAFLARNGLAADAVPPPPKAPPWALTEPLISKQLSYLDFSDLSLAGKDLRASVFSGSILRNADLSHADLRGSILSRADLRGANLNGAKLQGAFWSYTICPDGTISGAANEQPCAVRGP